MAFKKTEALGETSIMMTSRQDIKKHLASLEHSAYVNKLYKEPEEYINYFDQVLNQKEWQLDISKVEQQYLDALSKTLKENDKLYSVIRIPLHEEIPFIDHEAVKILLKKHPSISEKELSSAVSDYSPYTIVFPEKSYGQELVLSVKKELAAAR